VTVACKYVSIRHADRLAEAGRSGVVDSCDNVLAWTIGILYKAEVTHRQSSRNCEAVEPAHLTGWKVSTTSGCWERS
jgi:hypothetical protein